MVLNFFGSSGHHSKVFYIHSIITMKLYTDLGNFRAFKILIAAEYNSVAIEVPEFDAKTDSKKPEFLKKSPLGRVPVLETAQGSIFESNAIARYVARIRNDTELYGTTFFESAQVDSWIDFSSHDIELVSVKYLIQIIASTIFYFKLYLGCLALVLSYSWIPSVQRSCFC